MNRFTHAAKEVEDVKLQSSVVHNSNSLTTQINYPSSILLVGLFLYYMDAECKRTQDKTRLIKHSSYLTADT